MKSMEKSDASKLVSNPLNQEVLILINSKEQIIHLKSSRKLPRPIVTTTIAMIDILLMMFIYVVQNSFEGETSELSIRIGAKYVPCMKPLDSKTEQILYNELLKFRCQSFLFPFQFYRFLTPTFIHDNLTHLFSNLLYLMLTGTFIEEKYGGKILAIAFVLFGLSGNLLSTLYNPRTVSVGASGAIYGLLLFCLIDNIFSIFTIHDLQERIIQSFINLLVIPYFILSLFFDMNNSGHIDHAAHIGGALMGVLFSLLICPLPSFIVNRIADGELFIRFLIFVTIIFYFSITLTAFYVFIPVTLT